MPIVQPNQLIQRQTNHHIRILHMGFDASDESAVKFAPADALWDVALLLHVFEDTSSPHFLNRNRSMMCCSWVAVELCGGLEDRDVNSLL
jgi:hypothetical protein